MFDTLSNLTRWIFGDANERELKRLRPLVQKINELEPQMKALDDATLAGLTVGYRQRVANGEPLDNLLPEAFATVREASVRVLGMRHYDVQLIGGMVLHKGKIAEMRTGEGKTLVATGAVYLNAIEGKGVHVVTVNDYLAARDAEWMGRVYNFLGMSVGTILSNERNDTVKRNAYQSDITYGTNNEFGFDYLRDNMKFRLEDYVQRGHHFAIVDEVDSILVDEARTPLIISGPAEAGIELYQVVDAIIPLLQVETDFTIDEKSKSAALTDEGVNKVEKRLGVDNLYDPGSMEVLHHVMQSLKAHQMFKRDKDYVVRDGKVTIVDEFTGRLMTGRRWSDGLHQAVEAKEKVKVEPESQVYATITFQNLFRMYKKLSGMTGTAATEAGEFASIYNLDVMVIPTNRNIARKDQNDIVYKTQMEKFGAVVTEIADCHKRGQPVLVGTTSVEKSEIVAKLLERKGIPHEVLNAKNHAREASIISQAGRKGAVTISTNMAGRGTDIRLGGNAEEMARHDAGPGATPEQIEALHQQYIPQVDAEAEVVKAAGGLHIIGTERHESRRVDNQLRGRAGRQGDPGSSRFYLSLEDDLLRLFGTDKISVWMDRMGLKDDEPIEHRWITSSIENAQKKVEGHHFQMRKNLLEYDDVMNYQRKGVYDLRRRALAGDDIVPMVREVLESVVDDIVEDCCAEGTHPEQWNVAEIRKRLEKMFSHRWADTDEQIRDHSRAELKDRILTEGRGMLEERISRLGEPAFARFARMLLLQFTDSFWKDHLLAIDRLRQGVGLRGYGQRNPLLEYKREAFHMFLYMSAMRDESIIENIFNMPLEAAEDAAESQNPRQAARQMFAPAKTPFVPPPTATSGARAQALAIPETGEPRRPVPGAAAIAFAVANGVRRNDPCPCGSGMRFKRCCGEDDAKVEAAMAAFLVTMGHAPSVTSADEGLYDPPEEPSVVAPGAGYEDDDHAAPTEALLAARDAQGDGYDDLYEISDDERAAAMAGGDAEDDGADDPTGDGEPPFIPPVVTGSTEYDDLYDLGSDDEGPPPA